MRAREQGTEVDTMRKGVRRGSQCGSGSAQGVQRQSALSLSFPPSCQRRSAVDSPRAHVYLYTRALAGAASCTLALSSSDGAGKRVSSATREKPSHPRPGLPPVASELPLSVLSRLYTLRPLRSALYAKHLPERAHVHAHLYPPGLFVFAVKSERRQPLWALKIYTQAYL